MGPQEFYNLYGPPREVTFTPPPVAARIVQQELDRYLIMFVNLNPGIMDVCPDLGTGMLFGAIRVTVSTPLIMTFALHGIIVTYPWMAVAIGAATPARVIMGYAVQPPPPPRIEVADVQALKQLQRDGGGGLTVRPPAQPAPPNPDPFPARCGARVLRLREGRNA